MNVSYAYPCIVLWAACSTTSQPRPAGALRTPPGALYLRLALRIFTGGVLIALVPVTEHSALTVANVSHTHARYVGLCTHTGTVMQLLGKHLANDEALLTAEGATGASMGLLMMFNPKKAQDKLFDTSSSTAMTRVAGASLAAASTYALHAGFSGTGAEKRTACRVVALHSAVGAGLGLTQLAGKKGDLVMSTDKLKVATGVLAINSFFFALRANKRKGII